MPLLQTLDVSDNNMSGQPMSVLANMALLERINLQNNMVGPASVSLYPCTHMPQKSGCGCSLQVPFQLE